MAEAITLPNKGPYHPDFANTPDPAPSMAISVFPFDQKWADDPAWYDQLGRTLIEQRRILTEPRSEEERVEMVKKALEDAKEVAKEIEVHAREADEDDELDHEQIEIERQVDRLWSICLEVAIKGSAAVMRYLVREQGLHAATAPQKIDGLGFDLRIASYNGFTDVVKVLVEEAGADVNHQHKDQTSTALSGAARGGFEDTVKLLLQHGADISISDEMQDCIFGSAAESGNVEVMKLLLAAAREKEPLKSGSDLIRNYVLGSAAQSASVEMFKLVLEQGGYGRANDNTAQQRRDAILAIPICLRNDKTNWTCLDTIIDCALVRDDSGAFVHSDDVYLIDKLEGAILNSCIRVKPEELRKLLQLVLDATTTTRSSNRFQRILNEAIRGCYDPKAESCAKELLENWGANPNVNYANDKHDPWPLPLVPGAVSRGNIEWVRFWLEHGADIHRAHGPYCNGPTALAEAVTYNKGDIARVLLDYGGPVDILGENLIGKTTLYVVAYGSELNGVELTAVPVEEDAESSPRRKVCVLEFADGVKEEWVKNIQHRRPDTELAQDGTGRPRKGRHI